MCKNLDDELLLDKQVIIELSNHFSYNVAENPLHALRKWQLEKLHQTLLYAKENSYIYSKKLSPYNTKLAPKTKNQCYDDLELSIGHTLAKLDFTLSSELSEHPEAFLAQKIDEIIAVVSNSDHTKKIYYSQNDIDRSIHFFKQAMLSVLQANTQEKLVILLPNNSFASTNDLMQKSLENNGINYTVLKYFTDNETLAQQLYDLQCQNLITTPSQALELCKLKDLNKICRTLQNVLLLSETVSPNLRKTLSQKLAADIFVHYGLSEICHAGAVECYIGHGCHIRELDLIIEVVDSNNLQLSAGLWGEVVITTLNQSAMPLIRYKTGDLGRILPNLCPCGSFLKRLELQGKVV